MSDYKITKRQRIRIHVSAGIDNTELLNDLLEKFASDYDYEVTFKKLKQRGRTPIWDSKYEFSEGIEDRPS